MDLASATRRIVCPDCHGSLEAKDAALICGGCGREFPVVRGIPIVLGSDSAFDTDAVADSAGTYFAARAATPEWRLRLRRKLPALGGDASTGPIDELVNELVAEISVVRGEPAVGLVIGAGTRVDSFAERFPGVDLMTTDVDLTYSPDLVADGLSLPVADGSVDLVVCEHVVEHLIDPFRGAAEMERVLRPGGIVLIRMPFLYPWHGGYIDFFRATPAGMLVLFAGCEPVHLGPGMGPGAAAAYALYGGGVEMFEHRWLRRVAVAVLRVVLSPIKRMDRRALRRFGATGASAGITFVGRRVEHRRGPRELVAAARRLGQAGPDAR